MSETKAYTHPLPHVGDYDGPGGPQWPANPSGAWIVVDGKLVPAPAEPEPAAAEPEPVGEATSAADATTPVEIPVPSEPQVAETEPATIIARSKRTKP